MFSPFKPALIVILILTAACDSKDSNPKDYWTLNEPEIYAWDTSESANFRGFNALATEFDPTKITASLGYESYVLFKDRETVVDLEVQTNCTEPETGKILTSSKNTKIPKSKKIYFYNFLPETIVFDEQDQITSPDYSCNFNFIARNAITSERNFVIENVKINTHATNEIQVLAIDRQGSNIERTIQPILRQTLAQRPSVYFNSNQNTFVFDKTMSAGNLTGPAEIKCLGEGNRFNIQTRNGSLISALEQPFFNLGNEGDTAFLKKCRILAALDLEQDPTADHTDGSKEIRTVWSEYFNIIFDEPNLKIKVVSNPSVAAENYPFNTTNYLDSSVTVFQLEITNNSRRNLILHLPSDQKIKAHLSPIFYAGQKANYYRLGNNTWGGLRLFQTQDAFETELKFMQDGLRSISLEIPFGHSQIVDLVIDKNFMCHFANVDFLNEQPTSERGFIIKAIGLGSLQDQLQVDYMNQNNAYETFPDLFSLNTLLENSDGDYNSIRNSSAVQRRFKTNLLQINMNRTTVIDTVVLRDKSDLNSGRAPMLNINNMNSSLVPPLLSEIMFREIRSHMRSTQLPSIIQTDTAATSSCTQLY